MVFFCEKTNVMVGVCVAGKFQTAEPTATKPCDQQSNGTHDTSNQNRNPQIDAAGKGQQDKPQSITRSDKSNCTTSTSVSSQIDWLEQNKTVKNAGVGNKITGSLSVTFYMRRPDGRARSRREAESMYSLGGLRT
jgi:hypothetical protein